MKSKQHVQIIDLFAGPGGLGEGFSNCKAGSPFKIAMSVEKESNAHQTLTRRAFYRQLKDKAPYYDYIRCDKNTKEAKFEELKLHFPNEWKTASAETLETPHALGNSEFLRGSRMVNSSQKLIPKKPLQNKIRSTVGFSKSRITLEMIGLLSLEARPAKPIQQWAEADARALRDITKIMTNAFSCMGNTQTPLS